MSKKEKNSPSPILGNTGLLAGSILLAAIIILIGILFATGNLGGPSASAAAVPPDACGAAVMTYANANLIGATSPATLVSVTERNGMYLVTAKNDARTFGFYATKDCTSLFLDPYSLKAVYTPKPTASPKATTAPTPVPLPVKSARPTVELYVMSWCPFGVQAETAMKPVVDLLGTKVDFRLRYIATVNGDSVGQVKSLHGLSEAKEDLRQLCIARYSPEKLWMYVTDINALCYPVYRNDTQLAACQQNVTATLGMDNQKIETCANGSEGIALLRADETVTKSLKVTGSPTLFMNGQKYAGQRTAEGYKQALCERFETVPAQCATNLSSIATADAAGNC